MLMETATAIDTTPQKSRSFLYFLLVLSLSIISYFYFDRAIAEFMVQSIKQPFFSYLVMFSYLGDGLAYLITSTVLFILCKLFHIRQWTPKAAFVFTCLMATGIFCFLTKMIIARYRPDAYLNHHLFGFHFFSMIATQQSFPSGHTVTITTLMMSLAILFPRYRILFFIIMIAISLSRVVLHQHYLSDVILSMYISSLIVIWISKQREKKWFVALAR